MQYAPAVLADMLRVPAQVKFGDDLSMQFHFAKWSVIGALMGLAGCVSLAGDDPGTWYQTMKGRLPVGNRLYICHGFGCAYTDRVDFTRADRRRLARLLRVGRGSAEAERTALSKAVIWQEKRVGRAIGSSNDIGGLDLKNAGVRGQMDCIDEATNTTSLLLYLEENGLLRHHTVGRPVARGFFIDGRYPHATAVITEKKSGLQWAIDSWRRDNAEAPDVMPLDRWFRVRSRDLDRLDMENG